MPTIKHNWSEISVDTSDAWDKENDDPVEGVYLGVQDNVGPNDSKMYTVRTKDGDVKVWGSTVLDNKLANLPIGSYLKIEYDGKKKGKRGTSYHDYKVYIDIDYKKPTVTTNDDSIDVNEIPF